MLPKDPVILLSFVNTKLRDEFDSIDRLCDYFDVSKEFVDEQLNNIGYVYEKELNQYK